MQAPKPAHKNTVAGAVATVACLFALVTATLPRTAAAQSALPTGHPDLSQAQGGALPAGHPGMDTPSASTQPSLKGTLKIHAVQTTPGGPAATGEPVTIELYYNGQLFDQTNTNLSPDGTLDVSGLPIRMGIQPVVKVTHKGVIFAATGAIMDADHPDQKLDVPVYETTDKAPDFSVTMRHVMVSNSPTGLNVMEMLAVNTPGDRAWVGNADKTTLAIQLPAGATDVSVGGALDPTAVQFTDGKLTSHHALVPGEERYQLQYTVAAQNGKATLSITAPVKVGHVIVFLPDDGTTVTTTGLKSMGSQQMDDKGTKTRYYMATSLDAGQTVSLTVSGLTAAAAPSPVDTVGAADAPPAEAGIGGSLGSTLPKAVAAVGAILMLLLGSLALLAKKPVPAPIPEKSNTKGRNRAHR